MEILSNFSSVYCFISFILGAMFMLMAICIVAMGKEKEPKNNVHFYVARDKDGGLYLYLGKPFRGSSDFYGNPDKGSSLLTHFNFEYFGLNENDYENLKWEDEPLEVFVTMED